MAGWRRNGFRLATVVVGAGGAFIREETSCGAGFGRCSTGEPRCRKTSGNWGEPGRELGDMVGSWLGWRWDGKASIYLPMDGTRIFLRCVAHLRIFPAGYVRGHWITHWGRIKQYNSMARLLDFAFFGLVISWPTCTVYSLPFWCTKC